MQPPWGMRRSRSHDDSSSGRIIHLRVPHPPPPPPPPHSLSPPILHSDSQQFLHHPASASEDLHVVSQQYRDYSSHSTSHSQYYHPERQRRHWQTWDYGHTKPHPFTTQPPISSHSEHRPVHSEEQRIHDETRPGRGEVDRSFSAQSIHLPYRVAEPGASNIEIGHHQRPPYPPPPPSPPPPSPHFPAAITGHSFSSSSSSSSSSAHHYPPHPVHCTVEKVSAIDLIKSSRGEVEPHAPWKEEEEEEEIKEGGMMEGSHSTHVAPHGTHSADVSSSVDKLSQDVRSGPYMEEVDQGTVTATGQVVSGADAQGHMERLGEEEVEEEAVQMREEGGWVEEREGGEEGDAVTEYESSFAAEVHKFVQRNANIFNIIAEKAVSMETVPTLHNLKSDASYTYAEPDALEHHMQVDEHLRRQRFFKLVEVGDVVRGHVVAKRHGGLMIQITSFVGSHKYRELSDLSIEGVLPFENLAESSNKCDDLMRDMQLDDVVQAVVIRRDIAGELLTLSFQEHHLPEDRTESLGYKEGRRPASPRPSFVPEHDFLSQLDDDPGFTNPQAVANLRDLLGLSSSGLRPTLIRDLQLAHYPESDYAEPLRKAQRFKWSMKTVAVGVDRFKSGAHSDAMKYFNHALDIDSENVEGLVARGALFATTGKYKEGIADFQKALSIKNTHRNARKYLTETQVAYAQELEKQGNIDSAMKCYREVLTLDPTEETAKQRLGTLTAAMEKQAAEKREREQAEEEERERLRKLRKMIEKEKKKRNKEKRPKAKKRKKTGKHSSQKKRKKPSKSSHRHYDSSDESTSTASEEEEEEERWRSRSPSLPSRHRGGEGRRRQSHKSGESGESPSPKKSKRPKDSSSSSSDTDTSHSRERHRERSGRQAEREKRKQSHSHQPSSPPPPPRKERERSSGRTKSSRHHSHDHSSSKHKHKH